MQFDVGGLLPGRYRVTVRPAIDNGRGATYVPPDSFGLVRPQGVIAVGNADHNGMVLSQGR